MWLLKLILYLAVLAALLPLTAYVLGRIFKIDRRADVIHYLKTPDGWFLALHEYRPPAEAPKRGYPVLLCHGLGGNHVGWDFQEDLSVARYLASRGHRVFSLDLRGAGDSEKVGFLERKRFAWNFDSYLRQDVPTAIDGVLRIAAAEKLHWIGHSMGGMLGYSVAQTTYMDKLASYTAVSSPGNVEHFKPLLVARPLIVHLRRIYLRWITQIISPVMGRLKFLRAWSGTENLRPEHFPLAAANCQDDIPVTLMLQFGDWAANGRVKTADGQDLIEGLQKITIPCCFYAGENDITVPPDSVRCIHDGVGSANKMFHVFGPSHGSKGPYGHMTPLIGRDARDEVYPLLAAWLEEKYQSTVSAS